MVQLTEMFRRREFALLQSVELGIVRIDTHCDSQHVISGGAVGGQLQGSERRQLDTRSIVWLASERRADLDKTRPLRFRVLHPVNLHQAEDAAPDTRELPGGLRYAAGPPNRSLLISAVLNHARMICPENGLSASGGSDAGSNVTCSYALIGAASLSPSTLEATRKSFP